ncbi:MAG: InlB B-repeat-containing protein [Spirochaetaceae bacterium]|nr:InlB B-repeat-containing protein [Spirochaetaceae bacterium]
MRKHYFALTILLLASFVLLFSGCQDPVNTPAETPETPQVTNYTVTFNANNSAATGNTASITAQANSTITLTQNGFILQGYTFTGWNTAADGSGTGYADCASLQLTGNLTLYAQWEQIIYYTVTFIANHSSATGNTTSITEQENSTITLTQNGFSLEGFTFTGWNTEADGSGTGYADCASLQLTGNLTLYAQWSETLYYVNLIGIEGAVLTEGYSPLTSFSTHDETVTIPLYRKDYYTFTGWYLDSSYTGTPITEITLESAEFGETLHLYAKWTANIYPVNYDLMFPNQVTNPNTITTISASDSSQTLSDATYYDSNYTFAGWYTNYENGVYSNRVTAISVNDVTAENISVTLHAKWTHSTPVSPNGATVQISSMQTIATDIASLTTDEEFYIIVTDTSIAGTQFRSVNAALKANTTTRFYFDFSAATTSFDLENARGPSPNSFNGCQTLTGITLPLCSSFTVIRDAAFENCSALKTIIIPSSITTINAYAFKNCSNLEIMNLPENLVKIEYGLFNGCSSLTKINIPDSVTSIGGYAFSGCTNLETVYLPENLVKIENSVFYNCSKLTNTYYNSTYSDFKRITFGNPESNPTRYGGALYVLNDSMTDWERVYGITYNWSFTWTNGYTPVDFFTTSETVKLPTVENLTREGYYFDGWYESSNLQGNPIASIPVGTNKNITLYAKWVGRDDTPYKVLHYKENLNDNDYTLSDTENMVGTTATWTAAIAKNYDYYTAERVSQSFINGNGTTEVKIYYKRNIVTFTLDLAGGTLDDQTGTLTKTGKYGQTVSINQPQKTGTSFAGWNTEGGTLPSTFDENETYTAKWTSSRVIEITVGSLSDLTVTKSQNGNIITFTSEECDSYNWTLDDAQISTTRTCTIDTSTLLKGTYALCLEANKDGRWYSYFAQIKVEE